MSIIRIGPNEVGLVIYVTASVLGACTSAGLNAVGASRPAAMIKGFFVTFIVRSFAIAFGWSLPVFRASSHGAQTSARSEMVPVCGAIRRIMLAEEQS